MIHIRPAVAEEAELLTELAMRSKAYWGYSSDFMERCRPVLRVTADYLRLHPVFVAEGESAIQGFYSLDIRQGEVELDLMFVAPAWIGRGVGAALLKHAFRQAMSTRHRRLVVESDPQAEPFYVRFGADRIGWKESTVEPGRYLPVLAFELDRCAV